MIAIPRPARRAPLVFLISLLLVVVLLAHRSRFLIGLLFENGYPEIIDPVRLLDATESAVAAAKESGGDNDVKQHHDQHQHQPPLPPPLIPKIIHQTYKNTSLPEQWLVSQTACKTLHPDWEYMFWTDETAHTFIATEYPWFLPTYTTYPHAIQRADALRYFILHYHGGIYLDLDIEPSRPLSPLLSYPAWACLTSPTGISNDALGSVPGHPFFRFVIAELEKYDREYWGSPYLTVMYSTGPLFLSVLWERYVATQGARPAGERLWVLSRATRYEDTYGFFWNHEGGSWHGRDMAVVFWMGQHWVLVTMLGVGAGLGVCLAGWWCLKRFGGIGGGGVGGRRRDGDVVGYKPIMRSV